MCYLLSNSYSAHTRPVLSALRCPASSKDTSLPMLVSNTSVPNGTGTPWRRGSFSHWVGNT